MTTYFGSMLINLFGAHDRHDLTNYWIAGVLSNVLLVLAAISAICEFVWRPIKCWTPAQFADSWTAYTDSYCKDESTFYLPLHTQLPVDYAERRAAQLKYSMWIPLILLVHGLILRFPQFFWRITSKWSTVNLDSIVETARAYPMLDASGRHAAVKTASDYLQASFALRDPDDRRTKMATIRDYWQCFKHPFPIGLLSLAAVLTKALYALITMITFAKLSHFIGAKNASTYGFEIVDELLAGRELETMAVFPPVIMCDFEVRVLGNVHHHTVQCTQPLSHVYSRMFLILWFCYYIAECLAWICLIHSVVSTLLPWPRKWFVVRRLHRRRRNTMMAAVDNVSVQHVSLGTGFQVTRHPAAPQGHPSAHGAQLSSVEVRQFVENHLRIDGYFVLNYVSERGNDLFVYELINHLWRQFCTQTPANVQGPTYDHSVEQSPAAARHRFASVDHHSAIVAPPSVEIARRGIPASSIPSNLGYTPSTPVMKRDAREGSIHTVDGEEVRRPLLLGPVPEEKRYWDHVETIKM